jgi:hypothetical protein
MKKYLNSFKQSANLSSEGAMESEDHFKNGASLKSLTKKGLFFIVLLCGVLSAFAQSTVYLCYDYPNKLFPIPIKINNQEVFTLTAKTQKVCTFYSEGKIIISFDTPANNPYAPDITYQWADEIQLTLSKNSVHYVKIKNKGMKYVQIQQLSENEGKKEFARKKYKVTPEYIDQSVNDSPEGSSKKGKEPQRSKEPAAVPETEIKD